MRTFVAFSLPDNAVNQIVEWQQANLPQGAYPEPPTNLHMTLAFLGETPEELIPQINAILAELDPSEVSLTGPIEYRELDKLAFLVFQEQGGTAVWEKINDALRELMGYEPQFKPWLPHTTLWRFNPEHKPNLQPQLPSISFSPTAVTLYQSVKNPGGGATYQKVSVGMGYQEVWRYRVPFRAWHDGYIMGYPGDDHDEIDDEGFEDRAFEYGGHEQGHVIFHPEHGEITAWPTDEHNRTPKWLTQEYAEQLKDDARARFDEMGPYTDRYAKIANIFDPIEPQLDQRVYNGIKPRPNIVQYIENTFDRTLSDLYVDNPTQYFDLALTGSLTTYQYSETSDCDISVFVHYDELQEVLDVDEPGNIRRELIRIATTTLDGTIVPGTQHPLQFFIIPPGNTIDDYFQPGMRSGWSFDERGWIVPPEKKRSHDIASEMPELYSRAAAMADKMKVLLDAKDIEAAREFFAQIHKKRNDDEQAGLGDFSEGNIMYKYLLHEGLFDRLRNEAGVHIAKVADVDPGFGWPSGFRRKELGIRPLVKTDKGIRRGEIGQAHEALYDLSFAGEWPRDFGIEYPDGRQLWMSDMRTAAPVHNIDKSHITKDHKVPILYDFDRDRIIMSDNFDFHRGSKIIGEYDGKDVFLHGVSKQWINPNYFKRLWVASFPQRVLDKVHMDGSAIETRPADEMTYTQKLPWLVQAKDPWRKGKDWKDFIKNEGVIVDFQIGDPKDDPVEGRIKEVHSDSIRIEVKPGEFRTFDNDFLKQIKFRVRDDKQSLSHWKETSVVSSPVGDCPTAHCDYEFSDADNADIALARGWFTCPQCNTTNYVYTHKDHHKTSNVI